MAVDSSNLATSSFGNIDVGSAAMVFFATRSDEAAKSLKETMDSARKDSKTQKEIEAESKKLDDQLGLLRSPVMLDQRSRELNLGLVPVQPRNVFRIPDHNLPPRQWAARQPEAGIP
jgi:hypothetical protein